MESLKKQNHELYQSLASRIRQLIPSSSKQSVKLDSSNHLLGEQINQPFESQVISNKVVPS